MSDLQSLAQHIRSRGRGEDSMLVHMTPGEVGGLQALAMAHGGSLTIHPETGLPEAGFLSSLLPTLFGAALSLIPGVGPLMAAGMVGAGETALSGGNLGKGLMAGLGAFGGAGLASAVGSTFGGAAASAAGSAASAAPAVINPMAYSVEAPGNPNVMAQFMGAHPQLAQFGHNFAQATNLGLTGLAGNVGTGAAVLGLTNSLSPTPSYGMPKQKDNWNYQGPYQLAPRQVQFPDANRDPNDTSEFTYFTPSNPGILTAAGNTPSPWPMRYAGGGPVALKDGAFVVDARTVSELGNGSSGAGQELLAQHGGQPIQGAGDGVSDSVMAHVDGVQPARVARDEVKFDPEAVRRLGGGNARQGANKLYALMEQAKQARMSAERGQDSGLRGLLGR